MKRLLRRSGLIAVLLLVATSQANVSVIDASGTPSPEHIMQRAVERAKWVKEHKPDLKYSFTQIQVMEKLDGDSGVKERTEVTFEAAVIDGRRFFRRIAKNGKPLEGEDAQKEKERELAFRQRVPKKQVAAELDGDDVELNEDLVSRYKFTLVGKETFSNRPAFVLAFEPKSDSLPAPKRIDKVVNNLGGKVWVDEQEYELVKVEARLLKAVGFGWGLLASLEQGRLRLEQVRLEDGTWMPTDVEVYLKGRKLLSSMHQRERNRMNNFKKVG